MCGRFALTLPEDAVASWFDAALPVAPEAGAGASEDASAGAQAGAQAGKGGGAAPRYNICPSTDIPVCALHRGRRHLLPMRWGFLPRWYASLTDGPLLINARSETIADKPAFADAARNRRCLIPASGFYEWDRRCEEKLPWWVHPAGAQLMAFAGVWQVWNGPGGQRRVSCAIVTTGAGPALAGIHHREPVTIAPEDFGLWLGEEGRGAARLMHAAPEGRLRCHRVSRAVNSNRADGPELLAPLDD